MFNLNQLKTLYDNSPLWMKKIYASIPYEIRTGGEYRKWKEFLKQNLNQEEYTLLKIKECVLYAYENIEYYKNRYDMLDISPYEINSIGNFNELPFIDKNIIKANYTSFIAKEYPKNKTFYVTTGGSSGEPMKFLQSKNIWSKELAFGMNYFSKYGYKPTMLKASFRGGDFDNLKEDHYWKYNPINNEVHFSPFHINQRTIFSYVNDFNKLKPQFFHTYPSSILLLIEHMKAMDLRLNYKVKAIFLISENFSLEDIEIIRSFFHCEISSFYGHTERLIFAPNISPKLTCYKPDFRYGYFELIQDETALAQDNIQGEIIGTSFDNYAMPLIRYKTNDFTYYLNHEEKIIALIDGRWTQEYLLGKDGAKLYLTALNMHSDIFKNVIRFQYFQDTLAKAELRLVVNNDFSKRDKQIILDSLKQKVEHVISFNIKIVEQLELTKRGKLKSIVRII